MSDLKAKRRAIYHLLRQREAADAMATYYAFHHPDEKTSLILSPEDVEDNPIGHAEGFVTLSRTGIDLFRPLATMRLPTDRDPFAAQAAVDLLGRAFAPGQSAILSVPERYRPLLHALFEIQSEEQLRLYALDPARYEPLINVLVTRSTGPNSLPRFTIRSSQSGEEEIVASASLNWQSPHFAEIAVNTRPQFRRKGWGRSVVAAISGHLIESGRTPLYVVSKENSASIQLAESVGFTDTGEYELLLQATKINRSDAVKKA